MRRILLGGLTLIFCASTAAAQSDDSGRFGYLDVFELEIAQDPQISPDGSRVVYVRRGFDIMTDRPRTALWVIDFDGSDPRPLTDGTSTVSSPRWSPSGDRLLYSSNEGGSTQLFVRWMHTGQTVELTNIRETAAGYAWSPDGQWIAMTMFVPGEGPKAAAMPPRPKGAEWAAPPRVIEKLHYRADGKGYLPDGNQQIFVLPAEGGTPRQVTFGPYDQGGAVSWTPDSQAIVFSANRHEDADLLPLNTEIYEVSVETGEIRQITDRFGPDVDPVVSPDGSMIAYTGLDEHFQSYRMNHLYVMKRDGSGSKMVTELDRSVEDVHWAADGRGLYFRYTDRGNTKVAYVTLGGELRDLADNVGGLRLGRPYAGGSYSVARNGRFAYTHTEPDHPADLAVGGPRVETRRITRLNDDLFGHKELARVEELWWESSHDGRPIQGWVVYPPGFDDSRKYPFILEIHGGPFSDYGPRFSPEMQLYAAAGYVVLYSNPRGSGGYGEEFGGLIHHAYPGDDYHDLMSGVDAVVEKGFVDEGQLFVTGGSGGGVLTAWVVGKTSRFAAAASVKPVINWTSFALTTDNYANYYRYWLPGPPWEGDNQVHYWERSPLSLVGNVTTPTMMIGGELDLRAPAGEWEQFYHALKLRRVPTRLVRIQEAYHDIAARPSNLIAKIANILEWFSRYRTDAAMAGDA